MYHSRAAPRSTRATAGAPDWAWSFSSRPRDVSFKRLVETGHEVGPDELEAIANRCCERGGRQDGIAHEFQDFAAACHHRTGRCIEVAVQYRDVLVQWQLLDQPRRLAEIA